MLDLWYKNAVIYCLDVETFMDSNGDGVGDFRGLTDRLDHIETLGANCVWLLPFYPTPNRDNGYDITDFYGVDPRLGSSGDFVEFTHAAHDRGLRVIVDFVGNHTSTDHPWFQAARSDLKSPYRDWYVWSNEKPENIHEGVIFPGYQEAIWTYDRKAKAWYLHRFYEHQADLNIAKPEVREEIDRILGYWLQLGVSGFRIDAVPFLVEPLGLPEAGKPDGDPLDYLNHLRNFLSWRRAEAMMLAEANITFEEAEKYFGGGERMHMVFNFMLNQNMFLAFACKDAAPIRAVLGKMPPLVGDGQWANFLRNHDELDLGRLPEAHREEVFARFAPNADMRLYDRGIRRRLAPMLGGDERCLKMAHSLTVALPGTPVIWYGDEIGMGDDLSQPERNSVRAPMQWSDDTNAGFSRAPAKKLVRPTISDGAFGYRRVNVAAQRDVPGSLMEHVQRLIRVRRSCPEVGWGDWRVLPTDATEVLALAYEWKGGCVVTLHNLSDRRLRISLPAKEIPALLVPLMNDEADRKPCKASEPIAVAPYGFAWFRADRERR